MSDSKWYKALVGITAVLAVFAVCILIAWLYMWLTNRFPQTTETNYVTSITDVNGEEHSFLELNYYANANGTGKEVAELTFNFYSDENMTNVMSYTVQRITNVKEDGNKYFQWSYYQIAPENEISWSSVEHLKTGEEASPMYIDINGEPYCVKLNGTYKYYSLNFWGSWWNLFITFGTGDFKYYVTEKPYTIEQFFNSCVNHLTHSSEDYGSYNLPFVDLSSYFSIYKLNNDSKQWVEHTNVSEIRNFFSFDVSTHRYGLVFSSQSKVNMISGDAEFNISSFQGESQDYWKHYVVKKITAEDFDLAYSAADDGYWLSLNDNAMDELMNYTDLIVNVSIDLDYFGDKNILGLDSYALYGLNLGQLNIYSTQDLFKNTVAGSAADRFFQSAYNNVGEPSEENPEGSVSAEILVKKFEIKDYALWDTNLKVIMRSPKVNLVLSSLASNESITLGVLKYGDV